MASKPNESVTARLGQLDEAEREGFASATAEGNGEHRASDAAVPGAGSIKPVAAAALAPEPASLYLPPQPPQPIYDLNGAKDQIKEDAKAGDLVGITAHSVDPNGGAIAYKILADSSKGGFAIDGKTGVVSVKNPAKLDFETAASHKITVEARDWDGLFVTKTFVITLLDGNDAPGGIVDIDAGGNAVAENAPAGTLVGITAKAVDPNAGDAVTYSLTDDAGGRFQINAVTGVVSVKAAGLLDYETAADGQYAITVKATDKDGLTASQDFTLAVGNRSDTVDLATVLDHAAIRIDGAASGDISGSSVAAAGDVNGDGFDDLIVGAGNADPNGKNGAGSSYVIHGGDLLGKVTHQGSAAADVLIGGAGVADVMIGGLGDDAIDGKGGADVIRGGGGNDIVSLIDTGFFHIDGGGGADRLAFAGAAGFSIAAGTLRARIEGVETFDFANGKNDSIALSKADVLSFAVENRDVGGNAALDNALKLEGNAGDALSLSGGGWALSGLALAGYKVFANGATLVVVDNDFGAVMLG